LDLFGGLLRFGMVDIATSRWLVCYRGTGHRVSENLNRHPETVYLLYLLYFLVQLVY
jgi:hypothetical protein